MEAPFSKKGLEEPKGHTHALMKCSCSSIGMHTVILAHLGLGNFLNP